MARVAIDAWLLDASRLDEAMDNLRDLIKCKPEAIVRADELLAAEGNKDERQELGERIRSFTLEGETYWRNLFIANDTSSIDGKRMGMYAEGDELAPFFSEAFLYNLLGKDEARSVLGIIRRLAALAEVEIP